MTDEEARQIRVRIREAGDAQRRIPHRGCYDPDADRLWNEQMRLMRLLEDAGHPTYIKGEFPERRRW